MSSLANAVKRKTHKERSQPVGRSKYGLLEKRKDYQLRARDFHRKEKTIKALKRKAEERNPDEFYFAMQNKRTKGGVHDLSADAANKYTQEELALMRSQDVKYLVLKSQAEAKKLERLRSGLHFIGAQPAAAHTVFVDREHDIATFNPATFFDTPAELLSRTFNRPRKAQLQDPEALVLPDARNQKAALAKAAKRKLMAYEELSQRMTRAASLARTAAHLAYQKEVAGHGRKRKLSKEEKAANTPEGARVTEARVFKWRRERKK